jgi:primosomal protein N' (replication factor Y) (superfamily II helicase)
VNHGQSIARVVLDTRLPQLDRLFDYLIPKGMNVGVGVRVKVPLRSGARHATGYVVDVVDTSEHSGALAELSDVISDVAVLSPDLWSLARAIADRQAGNASDVLRLAIPARYSRVEKKWRDAPPSVSSHPPVIVPCEEYSDDSLEQIVGSQRRTVLTLPGGVQETGDGRPVPRGAQIVAQIAARTLGKGDSVVIVVPDWRDTEHFASALGDIISPEDLVVWRSGSVGSDRYAEYLRTLDQRPVVVVGNRHAVYAPVFSLGTLIVLDDADDSHREPLAPYPHTRDVALLRHQQSGCAVVFAGLVPSMSSTRWLAMGFCEALEPRHTSRPTVVPTALSMNPDHDQSPARLPSVAHQGALAGLAKGPILVQVFRAGYSSALACASCAERGMCARCHGPLRLRDPQTPPSCAWCAQVEARWTCHNCGSTALVPRGRGIGRTVAELGRAFPRVPIIQSDGENRVAAVGRDSAVVVATRGAEPIADGGYHAALLLDGQSMLSRENLGALEDTLRMWEHAVSLVRPDGKVFMTEVEGQPALALASGRYLPLLVEELAQREALRLPPAVRIASVSGPAPAVAEIRRHVEVADWGVDVLGPVPLDDGLVRSIVRFPYSQGDRVVGALRAAHLRHIQSQARGRADRVRIVVDEGGQLDALIVS